MASSGNESSFIRAAGMTNGGWELVHSVYTGPQRNIKLCLKIAFISSAGEYSSV